MTRGEKEDDQAKRKRRDYPPNALKFRALQPVEISDIHGSHDIAVARRQAGRSGPSERSARHWEVRSRKSIRTGTRSLKEPDGRLLVRGNPRSSKYVREKYSMRYSGVWRSGCTYTLRSASPAAEFGRRPKIGKGARHNRRFISDLRSQAAGAKMGHYFHRHSQGKKVKSFVPGGRCPQNGRPPIHRRAVVAHLT